MRLPAPVTSATGRSGKLFGTGGVGIGQDMGCWREGADVACQRFAIPTMPPMRSRQTYPDHGRLSAPAAGPLMQAIAQDIRNAGGWIPFDAYMAAALYTPGLGYYSGPGHPFGRMPEDGSDFATAPELSGLFAQALAVQLRQALDASATRVVCEFGAGSGALAEQLLDCLGDRLDEYLIIELSGTLRHRQAQRLERHGARVRWLDHWPAELQAVVVGNEVLDAMPVKLLHWDGGRWLERGVQWGPCGLAWDDRPTRLRPPVDGASTGPEDDTSLCWEDRFVPGTVVEVHLQAQGFMTSLAQRLSRGAAFFIDYGFPEREYYHPQRTGGTLMCHRAHRADADPLSDVGLKDITAHVNFTAMALAAQDAGLAVLGYTSQARFLLNCGIVGLMEQADIPARTHAARLIHEHEMGELFKVLGLAAAPGFDALGFAVGDRSRML
jgi:SAM-dependent MidA family methyltransferase